MNITYNKGTYDVDLKNGKTFKNVTISKDGINFVLVTSKGAIAETFTEDEWERIPDTCFVRKGPEFKRVLSNESKSTQEEKWFEFAV